MPTEVRIYTIKPGRFDEFYKSFREKIMPTSKKFGIRIHTGWWNEQGSEFVWMRSYDDPSAVERYEASPERTAYIDGVRDCIDEMVIRNVKNVFGSLPVENA